MKITGSSERIALLSIPLASAGVPGSITIRPGIWAYQASSRCECVAARQPAMPELPRKTIGTANWPPLMYRMLAALLTIWSIATRLKLKVMNSMIGRRPDHRRADADAGEPFLGDRRVDDPPGAEPLEHPLADLVGAVVLRDFLTHEEDAVVALHLLGHRLVQGFPIRKHGHDHSCGINGATVMSS